MKLQTINAAGPNNNELMRKNSWTWRINLDSEKSVPRPSYKGDMAPDFARATLTIGNESEYLCYTTSEIFLSGCKIGLQAEVDV
jgi:hypothetical protein